MCKRFLVCFTLVILVLSMVGCGEKSDIRGKWIAGNDYNNIEFQEDGVCIVDDKYIGDYVLREDNGIVINVDTGTLDEIWDINVSGGYSVEDGCLVIDCGDGSKAYYFSEDRLGDIINEEYRELYILNTGSYEYDYLIYTEDGDDFTMYYDREDLVPTFEKNSKKATDIFDKVVLPYYENGVDNLEYWSKCYGVLELYDGRLFYDVSLKAPGEGDGATIKDFAVNVEDETILVFDADNHEYRYWDGTLGYDCLSKWVFE